ncbi:hypothetical protein [Rhizobacter sp. SG703]|uniref:3'-5' exonuclease n=1 Tax=Rhizobacter sp. SG703 TaxID=2587140 RepID=UPI0017B5A0A0|nr:hypothetical protein [Rhizobacter sp. SG703]NKI93556.1 hypothetical protein [Rhizobacter sp. SG703]
MALVQPLSSVPAVSSAGGPRPAAAGAGAPAILDIEASGFGRDSYPIEVGYVLPDGSSFCSLIRPARHWTHWDPAAEQVHQIHRETLLVHGRPVTEVAQWLNDQLHGLTLYSDGWAHDYPWLGALYEEAGLVPGFRLDNLRSLLTEVEARDWYATKQAVSNELGLTRHRASADARLLQRTLLRLREPGRDP